MLDLVVSTYGLPLFCSRRASLLFAAPSLASADSVAQTARSGYGLPTEFVSGSTDPEMFRNRS